MNHLIRNISELKQKALRHNMMLTYRALDKAVRIAEAELEDKEGSRKRLPRERGA